MSIYQLYQRAAAASEKRRTQHEATQRFLVIAARMTRRVPEGNRRDK